MRLTLRTDLITSCGKGMKNCTRKKGPEIKHFFVWRALVATDGCDADCMVSYEPVLHGVSLCEPLDDLSDGWPLLTDGDVNAVKLLLLLTGIVKPEKVRSFKRGIGKSLKFQNKEKAREFSQMVKRVVTNLFWLMMASIATAVFPVWRSPMINSRWPRPMGTKESTALIPV